MISHRFLKTGDGTGYCTVHRHFGAVCLLENAAGDGVDTYRLSYTDWETAKGQADSSSLVTFIRNGGYLKSKTAVDGGGTLVNLDWMDYYHCDTENFTIGVTSWVCSAFQPELSVTTVTQGYPRFGHEESEAKLTYYMQVTNDASVNRESRLILEYDGAQALMAISAAAVALLSF